MKLAIIRAQLSICDATITGVNHAYAQEPSVSPPETDCPFVINSRGNPFIVPSWIGSGATLTWTYHFKTFFGLEPWPLDTIEYWNDAIAPFPSRLIQARMTPLTSFTLNNNADNQDIGNMNVGMIRYMGKSYFGFEVEWIVREREDVIINS